ncbi:TetR/AcrR family transcriptional regulator [Nonomuraea rhodomycinica]|uniref:TetR/AcrR family transcriptional regulator n=1 Tax=Nonomuraea rhodomycinica TaxID=1712872 RepID=A0A7Y6II73_9ACTN|nr:TetR/AcrR family transcriptional regulator [Nonomuraea rhodomycinica]NUW38729.1 TetR/AcrR family transcriptional regulator [Nonomuraea rhodomycinica]
MARTQDQRRAETRARLIDAAADLFARKGFHAVSAEAVAGAAGRTTGALYNHFGGKEGLLLALLEVWKDQTAAELLAGFEDVTVLDERLAALFEVLTRDDGDRGASWLLLEMELWLHGARDPEIGEPLARRYAGIRARLAEGLADWADAAGVPLRRPPERTATAVLGVLIGCAVQHRLDPPAVETRAVVEGLRDLLGLPDGPPHDHDLSRLAPKGEHPCGSTC